MAVLEACPSSEVLDDADGCHQNCWQVKTTNWSCQKFLTDEPRVALARTKYVFLDEPPSAYTILIRMIFIEIAVKTPINQSLCIIAHHVFPFWMTKHFVSIQNSRLLSADKPLSAGTSS